MLEQIADIAREHNLVIFSDEIYDKLILDDDEHVAMAAVAPDVPVVTFGGLSKNYLAPGWRIGWGILSGDAAAVRPYQEGINRLLTCPSLRQPPRAVCNPGRARRSTRPSQRSHAEKCAAAATSP